VVLDAATAHSDHLLDRPPPLDRGGFLLYACGVLLIFNNDCMKKFKALVFIRLRSQVDDSPGNAVRDGSRRLSELDIKKLRLGKVIDIWLSAPTREYAEKEIEMLSDRFYANTVMEDWDYELTEIETFPPGIE